MRPDKALAIYRQVLDLGAERLYGRQVQLAPHLDVEPAKSLYILSSTPEAFGAISQRLRGEERRIALEQLLTAAQAYIRASRKTDGGPKQRELGLIARER